MKDLKRKIRNWDSDNHIMTQHGKSIRANIARAFLKAHASIVTYRTIACVQRKVLEDIPKERCAQA